MTNNATRGTSPAFQLYASDLMANRAYRLMSLSERGLLLTLLCECWVNGEAPSSKPELSDLLGKDVGDALTSRVTGFFRITGKKLVSTELETYRERVIDRRNRMVSGGAKGGRKRAEKAASHPSSHPSREHSSHPSSLGQASVKGRGPGPGPGPGPEPSQVDEYSSTGRAGEASWD